MPGENTMRSAFKYFYALITISCGSLFADTLCTCEYFNQGHGLEEHVLRNGYNSPAYIDLDAGLNIIVKGTCLYWKVQEQGFDLGYSRSGNSYDFHTLKTDSHLGAKGNIGFHLPHDGWDFNFTYLFYRNEKNSNHIQSADFENYWYNPDILTSETMDEINSRWKLAMDIMDASFSRPFYLGTHLTVEPFIGAKGGWIMQKFKIPASYHGALFQQYENNSHSHSWILGMLGGFNTNWIIVDYLRIFANFSGSLLFQKFKISNDQKIIIENATVLDLGLQYKLKNITPSFETNFGVAWGTYFYNKRLHIDFSFGYDYLIFFDQNSISYIISSINNNTSGATLHNLTLHGMSGAIRLDF